MKYSHLQVYLSLFISLASRVESWRPSVIQKPLMLWKRSQSHPMLSNLTRNQALPPLEASRRTLQNRSPKPQSAITLTNVIIAANVLLFLAGQSLYPNINRRLMKMDNLIRRGQYYRLLTSTFVHGSLPHLLFNAYTIHQIGNDAERLFGKTRFFITYILAGVFANIGTYIMKTSPYSLGASGCAFGIIGAFTTYFYRNKRILGPSANANLESIKRTLLINVMYSVGSKQIDNNAHMLGFIGGALISFIIGPNLKVIDAA